MAKKRHEPKGEVIRFPSEPDDPDRRPKPLCDACAAHGYPRLEAEGMGECGHPVYHVGIRFCGRCSILSHGCRACGADVSGVLRRLHEEKRQEDAWQHEYLGNMLRGGRKKR